MLDAIVVIILLAIIGGASLYIYRAKKRGKKCIGCPYAGSCGAGGCSSCGSGCGNSVEDASSKSE